MYYAIYAEDAENSLEKRQAARPAHLERLEALQQAGRLLIAGPLFKADGENPQQGMQGSLIVAEFPDRNAATAWAEADPYVAAGVTAAVFVHPFKKVLP